MRELETERLVLRKFRPGDAKDMFENYANDPEVTRYTTWLYHKSVETTEEYLSYILREYEKENTYRWAIVLKETCELIGAIDVVDFFEDINAVEIGYVIGRKWWHQGIASEAAKKVTAYLISEGFRRIEACHDVENIYSGAVMRNAGMKFEGILRKRRVNNRGQVDIALYSLLPEDFTVQ